MGYAKVSVELVTLKLTLVIRSQNVEVVCHRQRLDLRSGYYLTNEFLTNLSQPNQVIERIRKFVVCLSLPRFLLYEN